MWAEHGLPLLLYALLSIGLTWPLVTHFRTRLPGESNDVHAALWIMWHVKEAVLGRQPLFELPLLYYPAGASLLTNALGPLAGFLSLPFWPLGPEAAYNGVVLISFLLTGYLMYLLARTLGLCRATAFFAGLYLLLAPMHVAGIRGHTTKMFLGLLPLSLLVVHRSLDLRQSERRALWWSLAVGPVLLLALLHTALQFIMAAVSTAFFIVVTLARAAPPDWRPLGRRLLWIAGSVALICGPLLVLTARSALDPSLDIDRNLESLAFRPDLLEFVAPPTHSLLVGGLSQRLQVALGIVPGGIETALSLSWVALLLIGVGLWRQRRQIGTWLLLAALWTVLALGPSLQLLGQDTFTEYELPVILPYAFLTGLPGLDFLRTPGRLMQMGFVAVGIAAATSLSWVLQRYPRRARLLLALAVALLLAENWPRPVAPMVLRPVPPFYWQIADHDEEYGVLDLPLAPDEATPTLHYAAYYQMYQMVHRKGIAGGYIPRTHHIHPVFPCLFEAPQPSPDIRVNGRAAPCAFHPEYDLPRNNYRYLVLHKPRREYGDYGWDSPGWQQAEAFAAHYLAGREPLLDDPFTRVYAMPAAPQAEQLPATVSLGANWHALEQEGGPSWRWAQSPATLFISVPRKEQVVLEIMPARLYVGQGATVVGGEGRLALSLDGELLTTVALQRGQMAAVPLDLTAGKHEILLSLEAGNFRPADHGQPDPRRLSFAISYINLQTGE